MNKNSNYNPRCQYCGCECNDYVIRDEDHTVYCSEECMLADRLRWRIQVLFRVLNSKEE